MQAKGMDVYV